MSIFDGFRQPETLAEQLELTALVKTLIETMEENVNSHPPIPPNCKQFRGNYFVFIERCAEAGKNYGWEEVEWSVSDCDAQLRPYIAAAARAAWQDAKLDESNPDFIEYHKDDADHHRDYRGWDGFTEFRALQWRLWGEYK